MFSASLMGSSVGRSQLELLLEGIMINEEKPKDVPPALPVRPVSRGRLPTARKSLPVNFKPASVVPKDSKKELWSWDGKKEENVTKSDKAAEFMSGVLGIKRVTVEKPEESPYLKMAELESCNGRIREGSGFDSVASLPSSARFLGNKFGSDGAIQYAKNKKLQVWCWLQEMRWELGKIQSFSGDGVNVMLSNGEVLIIPAENLLPANPQILDGADDLMRLSYLNEPSVLHNLKHRFSHDIIYTKAGSVLIAINPFKVSPLCGEDSVLAYRKKQKNEPHVFAVADIAFNVMMRDGVNQSIIISGESGSGKTETAKLAIQYLAALGGGIGLENKILQANLILEAFGNAKTSLNDNSSRFGKLFDIHYSSGGKICGAKFETFFIEKSRVVQRANGERSFHVFYQLCDGASNDLKDELNLKLAKEYQYLEHSNCLVIHNVSDAQRYTMLKEAFDTLKFTEEDQKDVFRMLAAVLWLGNINYAVIDSENHVEVILDEGVKTAAKLIACEVNDLILVLSSRKTASSDDNGFQKLTLPQAIAVRDALAKSIYSSLFDWLVGQINNSLKAENGQTRQSISILDFFGFESFQRNSFEQLCINYADERIQQHFNRHLFKLEQEEYVQDGIDWTNVDFVDNTECLNFFEKKQEGLFSLLNEVSAIPEATDLDFTNKLKHHLDRNNRLNGEKDGAFRICHSSGEFLYYLNGFLEKNRDSLLMDSAQFLASCSGKFPKLLAANMHKFEESSCIRQPSCIELAKEGVAMKFKVQLFELMQRLENTAPHFIRCIKSNSTWCPNKYDDNFVLHQLRSYGVLETVRISRLGYPNKITHHLFAERYGFLLFEATSSQDPLSVSVAILQQFNIPPEMYQVGYTKLFFRTDQLTALEDARTRTLKSIVWIQKNFRGLQAHRYYLELKKGADILQSFIQGERARHRFQILRKRWRAAILIQSAFRGQLARNHLVAMKKKESFNHVMKENSEGSSTEIEKNTMNDHLQIHQSIVAELQRQVQKSEAMLQQKEEENFVLQQQLQQHDARWLEYEAKMKAMEQTWQKQLTTLQMSLATARRSLAPDDMTGQPGRLDASPNNHYYDSEDTMSAGFRTPEETPAKQPVNGVVKNDTNGVIQLAMELEQRKQVFEDDAGFLVEVKSGKTVSDINPENELKKLKVRFAAWKKDYKVRLRETKLALRKLGNPEEKVRKKWWGHKRIKQG